MAKKKVKKRRKLKSLALLGEFRPFIRAMIKVMIPIMKQAMKVYLKAYMDKELSKLNRK